MTLTAYTEDTLVQRATTDNLEHRFGWRLAYAYIKEGSRSVSKLRHGTARRLYD